MGKSSSNSALKSLNIGDIKYIKADLGLKPNEYKQNLEKE
jgi:hypothetical protein